jgi:hypothetical protein
MESPSPQLDYQTPGNQFVRIRQYSSEFELRLAAARLEAEGILTQVYGEPRLSGMGDGVYRPQDLYVQRVDAEHAEAILTKIESGRGEQSPPSASPAAATHQQLESPPLDRRAIPVLLLLLAFLLTSALFAWLLMRR